MEQMQTEVSEFVEYVRQELVRAKAQGWEDRFEKALVKLPPASPFAPAVPKRVEVESEAVPAGRPSRS
jgi:hypothetical protein